MQGGWCGSIGSMEEMQAKALKRQEAAAKRERAMAYALTHQVNFWGTSTVTKNVKLWSDQNLFNGLAQ
jgi:hypothetical protein